MKLIIKKAGIEINLDLQERISMGETLENSEFDFDKATCSNQYYQIYTSGLINEQYALLEKYRPYSPHFNDLIKKIITNECPNFDDCNQKAGFGWDSGKYLIHMNFNEQPFSKECLEIISKCKDKIDNYTPNFLEILEQLYHHIEIQYATCESQLEILRSEFGVENIRQLETHEQNTQEHSEL